MFIHWNCDNRENTPISATSVTMKDMGDIEWRQNTTAP